NGSGKSTLVKILSGVHAPDAGAIELQGVGASAPRAPSAAQEAGIVTVFQEVLVAEARSVLDNVWLGVDTLFRAPVSYRAPRSPAPVAGRGGGAGGGGRGGRGGGAAPGSPTGRWGRSRGAPGGRAAWGGRCSGAPAF